LLGPLEMTGPVGRVQIGGAKERMVLALLALRAGGVVSRDALVDALWGDDPPATAVKTLQDYVKTAQEVRDDPTLTDIGKAKKLEQPLAKAAMDLHKIADTVLGKGAALMSKRADLLGVPSVEPGNAAQQLADRECREWFRGLSADERAEVMPKLMSGKLPAIAKALARSPIPLNLDEQKIEQAWRESVIASDPETFANMDKETEAADWAYLLVQRAAEKFLGSHGVTPQAVARILVDAGVDDAGPFKGVTLPHKWK